MPDDMDRAQEVLDEFREKAVEAAKRDVRHLDGEVICRRCQEPNDRARAGYAVCTDCVGEAA